MERNGQLQTLRTIGLSRRNYDDYFFLRVDIPYSVEQVPWNEEAREAREVDKLSIHFCGDHETAEVVFRTVVFVNQPSSYGAVADLCEELALSNSGNPSAGTGRLVAGPQTKDGTCSRRRPTDQIVLRCRVRKNCSSRTVFYDCGR